MKEQKLNQKHIILPEQSGSEWEYANFFWRTTAVTTDIIIALCIYALMAFLSFQILYNLLSIRGFPDVAIIVLLFPVTYWLYFAYFESSSLRATPGKLLNKMIVVNSDGSGLTFWDASARFIMAALHFNKYEDIAEEFSMAVADKKQDLEDIVMGTVVLRQIDGKATK